jgi:hypothetical protein
MSPLTVRPGTLYMYAVRAVDSAGNLSAESDGIEVRMPWSVPLTVDPSPTS